MKNESTISTKGQVTIPARVRKELNLQPQDKVHFEVEAGKVVLRPVRREDLLAVYNSVDTEGKPTNIHTIREETEKAVGEQAAKEGT